MSRVTPKARLQAELAGPEDVAAEILAPEQAPRKGNRLPSSLQRRRALRATRRRAPVTLIRIAPCEIPS
jgi:hypothetical protein